MLRRQLLPLSLVALMTVVLIGCSSNGTSTTTGAGVSVTTAAPGSTPMSMGSMPGGSNNIAVMVADTSGVNGPMTMMDVPQTAKAGKVTFTVKNTGTITHEVVVLELSGSQTWDKLPVTADKVSETSSKGEVKLDAGETKAFDLTLAAGKYALVCNIDKHYALGMRSEFTVV